MARDAFEVERLRTGAPQRGEQPALARARQTADDDEAEPQRQLRELGGDVAPVGAISAFELHGAPADFVENLGQCAAALPAAPAIDERLPLARALGEGRLQHRRDVARDQRRATLARLERRGHIKRADPSPLGVVEHGMIRRRGDVIRDELGGAAHVDAVGISGERSDADATYAGMRRVHLVFPGAPSRGRNSRQTLSSSLGCAAAVGWTRSGWNSALLSAKPSNMNGTSTILRALATSANVASKRCTYAGP